MGFALGNATGPQFWVVLGSFGSVLGRFGSVLGQFWVSFDRYPQASFCRILKFFYSFGPFLGLGALDVVRIDSVNSLIRDKIGNSSCVRILFRVSLSNHKLKGRVYSFRPKHHPPREVASGLR